MRKLMLGGNFLITGVGSLNYLENIKDKTVFIVTGSKSMLENGVIGKMEETLHKNECQVKVYSGIRKNPDEDSILAAMKVMNDFCPQVLIAIGGGSPMDAAKIMAIFYEYPQLTFEDLRAGKIPQNRNMLKFIAIPTTSGTASEVTRASVVTFRRDNIKIGLKSDAFVPDVAILDPTLTMTMPKKIVAETGMDAMTHAVEAYCNEAVEDFTEVLARGAVGGLYKYLPISYHEETLQSREKVHNYQCMAGYAFANAGLGMVHGIAHSIGGKFDEAHGLINAVVLPYVLEYNSQNPVVKEKLAILAKEIGVECFVDAIKALNTKLNIPRSFAEMGIDKEIFYNDLAEIIDNALQGSTRANPVKMTCESMKALLLKIYEG